VIPANVFPVKIQHAFLHASDYRPTIPLQCHLAKSTIR